MQVEVQGFVGAQLTYDNTYTLNASSSTLVNFNYNGIDQVKFIPVNPVTIFVMDNLTVTPVPEPGPAAFLSVAMALSALRMMKKEGRKTRVEGGRCEQRPKAEGEVSSFKCSVLSQPDSWRPWRSGG